jgi:hypothetical protein
MAHRTIVVSSIQEYLASDDDSVEERIAQNADRIQRLIRFPHSVMLKVSLPELDYADRWCWQQFGPCDGECKQRHSEYPACSRTELHSHIGRWTSHWFVKTDYNFGFNEWYFSQRADQDLFLAIVDNINGGEHYPR